MASDGDGRRRRSFLPAPKKTTALAFVPSKASYTDDAFQSHSSSIPLASPAYSSEVPPSSLFSWKSPPSSGAVIEHARAQPARTHAGDRMRTGRHSSGHRFGVGLRVGAIVKIGGVKPGILRYLGPTHFAPGVFCGIELLEADGNHDGKVNGHRYFVCAPNHGIFAPEEKVVMDTSSVSGRLPPESEAWDSGSERTSRSSRSYEKGQHEAMNRSKHGQDLGSHGNRYNEELTYSRHAGDSRLPGYANLNALYAPGPGMPLQALEALSSADASNRAAKFGLSRPNKTSQETGHSHRQHPSLPYPYSKTGDASAFYQRSSSCSSQSDVSIASSSEAIDRNQSSSPDVESDHEHERALRRDARAFARLSEGSHKDGSARYTLSSGVKERLRSDSKQYLNFTFDRDELNRSVDSDGFEHGNNFDYQDFALTGNYGKVNDPGLHFPNSASMNALSHGSTDRNLAPMSASTCSERLDGGKHDPSALSRSGTSHRPGVNTAGSVVYREDINVPVRCPLCNISLPTGMLSSSCPFCHGGRIFSDADTEDDEDKEGQPNSETNETADEAVPGAKDEDDDSSEPTGNTEDERIEADQLCGSDSKTTKGAAVGAALKVQRSNKDDDDSKGQSALTGDSDSCLVSPGSAAKEEDGQEVQSPSKDEGQSRGAARKPITITRKRSENVDHKMPNTNVTSRLADYIKAPVPVKTKEEKENELKKKQNRNMKTGSRANISDLSHSTLNLATSRGSSVEAGEGSHRIRVERPEAPRPIIKKTPRKNKWDNIMSQIEANKDKPKPITEVKSSLSAYLNAPPPQEVDTDQPPKHPRKEMKSKIKELPPPPPKIDYSKIKSKLNVPTAASAIKAMPKREPTAKVRKGKNDKSPLASPVTPTRETAAHRRVSDGSIILELRPITEEDGLGRTSISELTEGDNQGQPGATQGGVSSKRGPDPSQKENHRPSSPGGKPDMGDKITATIDNGGNLAKSASVLEQIDIPDENQNGGHSLETSNHLSNPHDSNPCEDTTNPDSDFQPLGKEGQSAAQLEVELVEALCEARAQVAAQSKMQMEVTSQAFDTMTALFKYCKKELKPLQCPGLAQRLNAAQKQLDGYISQTANLSSQREALDRHFIEVIMQQKEAAQRARAAQDVAEREEDARLTSELNDSHMAALNTQKEELSTKHDDNITSLTHFYERQIELLRQSHERQVADITNEGKLEINSLKICHLEEVQGLRNKHEGQMEDLHQQHRNKMEDMTQRFESIKLAHSEKVESLRKQCEDLALRAKNSEEALQKDADVKVQMALAPYLSLPSEIESLKSVQEMRIEEVQKLRMKIVDLEKQLEEMPIAIEKIISLQQKIENLGAIISIKTEREKQLHEKCQVLTRKYDRESRANKRISMDFEQVMWRMTQSSDFGSCESLTKRQHSRSPSRSQEEIQNSSRHKMSPGGRHEDVVLRVRKRSSDNLSESDRKLRSKSASFLIEHADDSVSPSLSPQLKQKKRSKKSPSDEISADRMFHSAGPEFISHLLSDTSPKHKEWSQQKEINDLKYLTESQETSSSHMVSSYTRSNSGISDSGVYDSMTRSDQLNTSVASTDSEWGTSVNILVTTDSKGVDGSGPPAGDYQFMSDGTASDG